MRRSDRLTGKNRPNGTSAAEVTDAANQQPRPAVADTAHPAAVDPSLIVGTEAATNAPLSAAANAQPAEPETPKGFRFVDRRALLRLAGTAAAIAPATGLLAACSGSKGSSGVRPVRIGMVTPQSGALSAFSETDLFMTDYMTSWFKSQGGIAVGNSTHPVEVFVRDSQSTFARAAKAATLLIDEDNVDIVLVDATSETINPVADQCEVAGIPCVSTMAPWESWYFSRGGTTDLKTTFNWSFHFFAGLADYYAAYSAMWGDRVSTNRSVGALWPADVDGMIFANTALPFYQNLQANWRLANPQFSAVANNPYVFQPGTPSFIPAIQAFQSANVQIVTGVMSESDFAQFERDANTRNFQPKIVTISKAAMFAADLTNIGPTASNNLTTELFWSSSNPNRSFVTNLLSKDLAEKFISQMGRDDAPQQLGATMALFDVVAQALSAVSSIDDRKSIATALKTLTARTILGQVKFAAREDLPRNVAAIPLNGAQWEWSQSKYKWTLVQVNNTGNSALPNQQVLQAMNYDI